ncbi:MAG TPA: hypothetical protein VLX29_12130 [Nitrospirota bacterium]|nr:hypothetical protein [Nitrospirota bacterium]
MAQRQCPSCKMTIDASVKVCPHCRHKLELSWPVKILLLIILCGIVAYCIGHFNNYQEGASNLESIPVIISISAPQLIAEYEYSEGSADAKFKGRLVIVTGVIDTLGKDSTATPYVTLGTNSSLLRIQCRFIKSEEARLSNLHPGQQITVIGDCRGKKGYVQLENCTIKS